MLTVTATGDEPGTRRFYAYTHPVVDSVTFNWSISSGSIKAGQGTNTIVVSDKTGHIVTATVEIGGLPPECSPIGSETDTIN